MPKVTVIMNCLNGERFQREAIDSVYAQTFADWEIVFWDNASTDGTAEIAKSYDGRLRYFRSAETVPLGDARSRAWREAQGEWVGFLDCDDYWFPDKLQKQMDAVSGGDYALCYAGVNEVDIDGNILRAVVPGTKSGMVLDSLLRQFDINMVTPILHRQRVEALGLGFDSSVTASEEYNLFVRLSAQAPFCVIPEALGVWRIWPGTLTSRQISKWADERLYTLEQLERENPGIGSRHPEAFAEARARAQYYRARYLVTEGRRKEARAQMRSIASQRLVYAGLWLSLYVPGLWDLLHNESIKRGLSGKVGISTVKQGT